MTPSPSWLVSGDNAWQLISATLVGIMSIPGLAILSARLHGLRRRRHLGLRVHHEHDDENGSGGQPDNTGHDREDCSPD